MEIKKDRKQPMEMTFEQAFRKLSALCARGEHCQYEMLEKMRRWGVDESVQAKVMERLVNEHYIDDTRYATAFVHDKVVYNKWGRKKVEQALRMKRIDQDVIEQALDAVDVEDYIEKLAPLIRQKLRSTKAKNDYERNMKVMKWALSRGYTMDVIRQCMSVTDDADEFLD
jgi:regulatory protein